MRTLFLFCLLITSCSLTNSEREQVIRDAFVSNIVGRYVPIRQEISMKTIDGVRKITFSPTGMIEITSNDSYLDIPIDININTGSIGSSEIIFISRGDPTLDSSLIVNNTLSATAYHFTLTLNTTPVLSLTFSDRFSIAIKDNQLFINGSVVANKVS
ncbi:MAG: hypothetical protein ACRCVW_02045 [Brevinema sp.]